MVIEFRATPAPFFFSVVFISTFHSLCCLRWVGLSEGNFEVYGIVKIKDYMNAEGRLSTFKVSI